VDDSLNLTSLYCLIMNTAIESTDAIFLFFFHHYTKFVFRLNV